MDQGRSIFQKVAANTKCAHRFAENVQRNEAVAKKLGEVWHCTVHIFGCFCAGFLENLHVF